ncbi:putative transcription factor interactor and regulator CCHC(Zn) family [Helianthus anomalus]
MVDVHQEISELPTTVGKPTTNKELNTDAMKRISDWIFSQEIPSDVTVCVGDASFPVHKVDKLCVNRYLYRKYMYSLVRYRYMKVKNGTSLVQLSVHEGKNRHQPGTGSAKSWYRNDFENLLVREIRYFYLVPFAHPWSWFPLVSKCGYIKKLLSDTKNADLSVVEIPDIPGGPEGFELAAKFCYETHIELSTSNIPMARCVAEYLEMTEKYSTGNLVSVTEAYLNDTGLTSLSRVASILQCSGNLLPISDRVKLIDRCVEVIAFMVTDKSRVSLVDWWAEDLIVLRIDIFKTVLVALVSKGFKQFALAPVLTLYAQKRLRGLKKTAISISLLSMLLRAAKYLDTMVACRLDLEKRMGLQLGQAVLDDISIPSCCFDGDTMFDVDTIQQIVLNYFEYNSTGLDDVNYDLNFVPPLQSDDENVGKLMESFLAKIASDRNLLVSKFISFAECIPVEVRVTEDGMYRAINIYLKLLPGIISGYQDIFLFIESVPLLFRSFFIHSALFLSCTFISIMSANHITTSAANVYSNVYGGDVSDGQHNGIRAITIFDAEIKPTATSMPCQHCIDEKNERKRRTQRERLCYYCHLPGHQIYTCKAKENDEESQLIRQAINDGIRTQNDDVHCRDEMVVTGTDGGQWNEIWKVEMKTGNETLRIPSVFYSPDIDRNVLSLEQLTLQGFTVRKSGDSCKIFPMFSSPVVNSLNDITGLTKEDELGLKEKERLQNMCGIDDEFKSDYLNSYFETLNVSEKDEDDWNLMILKALEFHEFGDCM